MPESVAARIDALRGMLLKELRVQYGALFGDGVPMPARADQLRARIAYRLQEAAFGGLSPEAKGKLEALEASPDLGNGLDPARIHRPARRVPGVRDRRLPLPGTLLRRDYKGEALEVKVLEGAFEFQGRAYRSLTALAREITGSHWNGFLFFGLA